MNCKYCGHGIKTDAKFCTNCGKIRRLSVEKSSPDEKKSVTDKTDLYKPALRSVSRDHTAWLHWLIVTIVFSVVTFTGSPKVMFIGIIFALAAGAYTYYIFQGGRYVFVNRYLELFVMLFTKGFNKKLSADDPPSQAWIVWAVLTFMLLLYTITGKFPNVMFGLVTIIPAGAYTGYLFTRGKYVYVPIFIMITLFILITGFFQT